MARAQTLRTPGAQASFSLDAISTCKKLQNPELSCSGQLLWTCPFQGGSAATLDFRNESCSSATFLVVDISAAFVLRFCQRPFRKTGGRASAIGSLRTSISF